MKTCSTCRIEKTLLEFSKNKSTKDGLQYRCKQCEKDYYWSNRDKIVKKRKESFEENKDLVLAKRAEYYKKHQDKKIAYSKAYREINREKDLAYKKEHYYNNKEYYANKHRAYSEKNKEHLRAYHTKYCAKRRSSDPMYRLVSGIRSRISTMCYSLKANKNWKTLDAIGCSREDFKSYIESHFVEGMTWDNYGRGEGKWSIDHTKPLCTANTEEDVFTLNHYTNLRPMWWFDNLAKGGKYEEQ